MARLVSRCNEVDEVRWLWRKSDFKGYYLNEGIKRGFFMKATQISSEREKAGKDSFNVIRLSVDYSEDIDSSVVYRYHSNLCCSQGESTEVESGNAKKPNISLLLQKQSASAVIADGEGSIVLDFKSWKERFFDLSEDPKFSIICESVDSTSRTIIVKEWIKDNSMELEDLKINADNNLRRFDMSKFNDDILKTSPRDLKTKEEKKDAYSLSESVSLWQGRIDYFVSHSWEDSSDIKCPKLKTFSKNFKKRHNRYPWLWLDKVCINQEDSSIGLAVLPININACDKFLILLSKTYIRRLWCIWELFTLFCFVSKESLVFDRIEFLVLESEQESEQAMIEELRRFDINEAACFGPNEEFQLRYIIMKFDPTGEKMKKCFTELANMLEIKLKGTETQRVFASVANWFARKDKLSKIAANNE